jgi:hypothetical protein
MVAEIAEQLYRENIRKVKDFAESFDKDPKNKNKSCDLRLSGTSFPTSVVAFNIMEENNPKKAQAVIKEFKEFGNESKNPIQNPPEEKNISYVKKFKKHYEYLKYFNQVVWIQFNDKSRRSEIEAFAKKLDKIGWNVPKNNNCLVGEYTEKGYTWKDDKEPISTVRFYHISDRGKAERIQKLAKDSFKQSFDLDDMSVTTSNIPFGQIEVWIYFNQDPSNQDLSNQDPSNQDSCKKKN